MTKWLAFSKAKCLAPVLGIPRNDPRHESREELSGHPYTIPTNYPWAPGNEAWARACLTRGRPGQNPLPPTQISGAYFSGRQGPSPETSGAQPPIMPGTLGCRAQYSAGALWGHTPKLPRHHCRDSTKRPRLNYQVAMVQAGNLRGLAKNHAWHLCFAAK